MKKSKFFVALLLATILCMSFVLLACAAEQQTVEQGNTWVTRIVEYARENKEALLGLVGDLAIFVLAVIIKITSKAIKQGTDNVNESQASSNDRMNVMIDGYNKMRESYEQYGATEEDRNRVVGVLVAQNTAILDMLATAYGNSKNLSQGVKDMIMLKYAGCMKTISEDEQILGIVEAVREKINLPFVREGEIDHDVQEEKT